MERFASQLYSKLNFLYLAILLLLTQSCGYSSNAVPPDDCADSHNCAGTSLPIERLYNLMNLDSMNATNPDAYYSFNQGRFRLDLNFQVKGAWNSVAACLTSAEIGQRFSDDLDGNPTDGSISNCVIPDQIRMDLFYQFDTKGLLAHESEMTFIDGFYVFQDTPVRVQNAQLTWKKQSFSIDGHFAAHEFEANRWIERYSDFLQFPAEDSSMYWSMTCSNYFIDLIQGKLNGVGAYSPNSPNNGMGTGYNTDLFSSADNTVLIQNHLDTCRQLINNGEVENLNDPNKFPVGGILKVVAVATAFADNEEYNIHMQTESYMTSFVIDLRLDELNWEDSASATGILEY